MTEPAGGAWKYETRIQCGACRQGRHEECPVQKIIASTRYTCNCSCHSEEAESADRPG